MMKIDKETAALILQRAPVNTKRHLDIEHFRAYCELHGESYRFSEANYQQMHRWLELPDDEDDDSDDGVPEGVIEALMGYDFYLVRAGHRQDRLGVKSLGALKA